jgi:hypothetical protein
MRTFQIWSEGYRATGQNATANRHGVMTGENFREACLNFFKENKYYDAQKNTYWGCRLFPDEHAARQSFG